ncbi:hypothetical protein I5M83_22110 [Pseudomonas aeruginosa]|uniref:Uncharacterized protein n=1 Tax=Pseudomonas aeruginosa TaxID=287 RepID=A0A6H1QBL5_PSEAI|nr:hypothetical protein [Pseudomonas aeruginosa]MBH4098084.1 hypothetical protein [Pseudomonas aeruginosa]QIZ23475.1 hypothetical protein [Pseudomonas aeruginosa]
MLLSNDIDVDAYVAEQWPELPAQQQRSVAKGCGSEVCSVVESEEFAAIEVTCEGIVKH